MTNRFLSATALALLAVAAIPQARSAEAYDNCTGFIDSVPATISTQGTWCLRKNLSTSASEGAAINVIANNVTLDCNDFKLGGLGAGPGSQATGIQAEDRQNIAVRQCNLRGFNIGIRLLGPSGGGHLVEDNRVDNSLSAGIEIWGDNNLVRRNRVFDSGGAPAGMETYGILGYADMVDNIVAGVVVGSEGITVAGIYVMGEAEIRGNIVRGLVAESGDAYGLFASNESSTTTFTDNRVIASAATSGHGIRGTFCTGNIVSNYLTPFDCAYSQDNLTQEAPP